MNGAANFQMKKASSAQTGEAFFMQELSIAEITAIEAGEQRLA